MQLYQLKIKCLQTLLSTKYVLKHSFCVNHLLGMSISCIYLTNNKKMRQKTMCNINICKNISYVRRWSFKDMIMSVNHMISYDEVMMCTVGQKQILVIIVS